MTNTMNITFAALEQLLQAAYEDGHEDGVLAMVEANGLDEPARNDATGKFACPDDWTNSVTADHFEALTQRVRNGGTV